jgi:hypothetical protein
MAPKVVSVSISGERRDKLVAAANDMIDLLRQHFHGDPFEAYIAVCWTKSTFEEHLGIRGVVFDCDEDANLPIQ